MHVNLTDRVVLVTGASRGIGRAIAEGLAEAGAAVGLHYHRNAAEAEALAASCGGGARVFQADLGEAASCERLFDEVLAAYGRVDVLVNNAGIALEAPLDAPAEAWVRDWDRTMAVNLRSAGQLSRRAVRHFVEAGGGRLVHIASRAAFRGDTPDYLAYAASKGGMVALSRSIARGFGKQGVRSFVVAPGFTRTDMAQDFIDAYGEDYPLHDIALERLTEPADIAPIVVLLASGLADHASGCTIDVNAASYVR